MGKRMIFISSSIHVCLIYLFVLVIFQIVSSPIGILLAMNRKCLQVYRLTLLTPAWPSGLIYSLLIYVGLQLAKNLPFDWK